MQNAASLDGERSVPIKQAADSKRLSRCLIAFLCHVLLVISFRDSVQIAWQMSFEIRHVCSAHDSRRGIQVVL